jgi:20S proteasome subunit beta 6
LQVGDGLEMYVVLAKGRLLHGLEESQNIQEISSAEDEERVFVIRRELKKD